MAVRSGEGFGVVGSSCSGTCVSGFHEVQFRLSKTIDSLVLENSYQDQDDPTGALQVEAYSLSNVSMGVVTLSRSPLSNNFYNISQAFGERRILWFIVRPSGNTIRISSIRFRELPGECFFGVWVCRHYSADFALCVAFFSFLIISFLFHHLFFFSNQKTFPPFQGMTYEQAEQDLATANSAVLTVNTTLNSILSDIASQYAEKTRIQAELSNDLQVQAAAQTDFNSAQSARQQLLDLQTNKTQQRDGEIVLTQQLSALADSYSRQASQVQADAIVARADANSQAAALQAARQQAGRILCMCVVCVLCVVLFGGLFVWWLSFVVWYFVCFVICRFFVACLFFVVTVACLLLNSPVCSDGSCVSTITVVISANDDPHGGLSSSVFSFERVSHCF